jgi:hypothetical protein
MNYKLWIVKSKTNRTRLICGIAITLGKMNSIIKNERRWNKIVLVLYIYQTLGIAILMAKEGMTIP